MEHRTTVVEFSIAPGDLFAIAEDWANTIQILLFMKKIQIVLFTLKAFA